MRSSSKFNGRFLWQRVQLVLTLCAPLLGGCSDAILGTWEQDKNTTGCGKIDFTLGAGSSGSVGEGVAPIANDTTCVNCQFSVVARNKGEADWDLTMDFDVCAFDINSLVTKRLELECVLAEDDEVLSCTSALGSLDFEKVD
jgi:hypothetical protein